MKDFKKKKKRLKIFIGRREQEQGSCTRPKIGLVVVRFLSFRGGQGSIRQITLLMLIRQFLLDWFKIPVLGQPKL